MNSLSYYNIDVSVNINGRPVRTHHHDGRIYIESREGSEYSIEIKNNNGYRVEVVASVDGLGVINGKPASANDSGYVVPAYGKLSIKGYRKDSTEVGAFRFTRKESSYASEKGGEVNVGVIAIAVWKEKVELPKQWYYPPIHYHYHEPIRRRDTHHFGTPAVDKYFDGPIGYSTSARSGGTLRGMATNNVSFTLGFNPAGPTADNVVSSCYHNSVEEPRGIGQDHGTTWGQAIADNVSTTEFTRDYKMFQTEIFYDSRESLLSRGIKLTTEKLMVRPQGFPSDFAPPPRNWRG